MWSRLYDKLYDKLGDILALLALPITLPLYYWNERRDKRKKDTSRCCNKK